VDTNHTALWWNEAESGWGININHQGTLVFATLFTYNPNGSPLWLVDVEGDRQADGSYSGILYKTTGPVFNASPWSTVTSTRCGTMTHRVRGENAATLTYTYNGCHGDQAITRQAFRELPTCSWVRVRPHLLAELPGLVVEPERIGLGVNFTHQEDIVFATLSPTTRAASPCGT
jgi:hypothetical protein